MKTSLTADMLLSIATGSSFLNHFRIDTPHRVLFMSGESGFSTLQETARRICEAKGIVLADAENMLWSEQLPQFGQLDHVEETRRVIGDQGIELLAVDPCYLAMSGADAGNLFVQGAILREMAFMCREEGASLLIVHHTKNLPPQRIHEPLELSDLAWAGFQEFARQWLLINRRETYEPGTGEHRLWFNVGGSAGHGGLWAVDITEGVRSSTTDRYWDVNVAKGTEARTEATKDRQRRRAGEQQQTRQAQIEIIYDDILQAFNHFPDHRATKTKVRDRVGRTRVFDEAWYKACNSGELIECEVAASNGQKYAGFQRVYKQDK